MQRPQPPSSIQRHCSSSIEDQRNLRRHLANLAEQVQLRQGASLALYVGLVRAFGGAKSVGEVFSSIVYPHASK